MIAARVMAVGLCAAGAWGQNVIARAEYEDRLRAMWLGQCIANWTGLRTEGARIAPPFFTDADWGTQPAGLNNPIEFVLNQDPWLADDDTDVEYVYLHTMAAAHGGAGRSRLTAEEIRDAWLAHMDPNWIWVSNRRAWDLMGRGVRPPMTAHPVVNDLWAFIDAQLTTEFFGAMAPGMPEAALANADLPIRTTAFGHAIHAAQFYVALYALASRADASLSGRDKAVWLVREARKWIPGTSKAADIADYVLADFLSNPDVNDWERTRDRIAQRYMMNAAGNGFVYFNWAESSVNFACGVMALLYGECDYKRTVQIGTLSGWDSDNATATLGGLIGLMLGYEGLRAQFPGVSFSDRYDIERTRNGLPDYLPGDPQAQDTFSMIAARMMPLVDGNVRGAGGGVTGAVWVLPAAVTTRQVLRNPGYQEWSRSANCRMAMQGVWAWSSAPAGPNMPTGVSAPSYFANGYEHDFAGRDGQDWRRWPYTTEGTGAAGLVTLQVEYGRPVEVAVVRFIEGDHTAAGGWFELATVQVKVGGVWVSPTTMMSEALDPAKPFQVIDFAIEPVMATGVRVVGQVPSGGFVTCAEVDGLSRSANFAEARVAR